MTRKLRRWVALLGVGAWLAGALGCSQTHASSSPWKGPFFFIQMADPQFGMFAGNADCKKETELFTRAIGHANRLKPAFVVICGDLINAPGDETQTAEFQRIAGMLDQDIPLYLVSGNHDLENVPTPESLKKYRRSIGDDWYPFGHGNCRFIVINSTIIDRPDHVEHETQRQKQWLETELQAARRSKPAHIIVFQHHPWFTEEPDEKDSYANLPRPQRKGYLTLLENAGVTAVFAGHLHRNLCGRYGTIEMVTTGPVGKPLGKDPSGLGIVKVYRDRIEHEYYSLDAVPARVELNASR